MLNERLCRSKEAIKYVYITKDNVEEFVNKYGNKSEHTITFNERFAKVEYSFGAWYIKLNAYMVYEDYPFWKSYTQEEFEEKYEIIISKGE